jgi:hypothetical protein
MPETKFDSFGEPVNYSESSVAQSAGAVAGWLARAGTVIFWSLVAIILVARAVFYDPNIAGRFDHVAELSRAIRTVLGV